VVYVGAYERAYYDPAGLAKFDDMAAQGLLRVVYDAQGVRIYEVVQWASEVGSVAPCYLWYPSHKSPFAGVQ